MTAEEGRAWLELLAELAPRLRAAKIFQVELGPMKCRLALEVVVEESAPAGHGRHVDEPLEPEPADDPLDDGDTFGTKEAPGYAALRG